MGLIVNQGSGRVSVREGGDIVKIPVTSTVPILCPPQDRAFGECCLVLDLALTQIGEEQRCPQGNVLDRVRIIILFLIFTILTFSTLFHHQTECGTCICHHLPECKYLTEFPYK